MQSVFSFSFITFNGNMSDMQFRKIDMWYLHGPDRSTPYEVTFKAVNDLHKEGQVPSTTGNV